MKIGLLLCFSTSTDEAGNFIGLLKSNIEKSKVVIVVSILKQFLQKGVKMRPRTVLNASFNQKLSMEDSQKLSVLRPNKYLRTDAKIGENFKIQKIYCYYNDFLEHNLKCY